MRTHIESKWHNGDRAFLRADVDSLVGQMTMEEKILMLAGADWWHTLPVHRLNIPSVKVTDGPNGARGESFAEQTAGLAVPCETALAATFSPSHVQRLANVLARETKDRGAVALLAPTVNIIRHPQGGRSFENFSEDTFLSGAIATAYIRGLQEEGVAAVVKHFVCNDQEHERSAVNVQVGERALREVYLKPFQMVVEDAKPLSIMSSYNKVNGEHVAESRRLLTDIVRNEWGFDGMIMSDWFGTYSVEEGIIAGQDLEMPGPAKFRTLTLLNHALATRRIQVKHINDAVSRILTFAQRVARLSPETVWGEDKEVTVVREDDRLTMREVGAKSHVLLKNDGAVLPLTGDKVHKIAVIGSRATATTVFGGGSAQLNTDYVVTVLEGMQRNAPDGVGVEYALGCVGHRYLPYLECTREDGQKGCDMRLYAKAENMNSPTSAVKQLHLHNSSALISDAVPPSLAGRDWFGLLEGEWVSPHEGEYEFGVIVAGRAKLFLNDTLIVDNWSVPQHRGDAFFGQGTTEVRGSFTVSKGERYWVKCEYSNVAGPPAEDCSGDDAQPIHNFAVRVGGHPKMSDEETIAAAVKLAREADAVVLAVGLGPDFETEGADRAHLRLPLATDRLIEAVAAVNPRTVVAVQSGSICLMPWADKVPAIVQAWYGGCESGASLASVIYGHVNPSGRLPLTIPKREEDIPAFLSFKSQKGIVRYNDDVHVGWKAYLDRHIEPSFAFGHGLSYTTFAYDDLSVKATSEFDLEFSVVVKNTGDIPGSHSALLYLSPPAPTADSWIHPSRRLAGFQFIEDLGPGQQRTARIRISRRELAHWDEVLDAWTVERGVWSAFLTTGSALDDVAVRVEFTIRSEVVWRGH